MLSKSGGTFTFRPTGARYGVAVACATPGTGRVVYATTQTTSLDACPEGGVGECGSSFSGTLSGTLSGVGTSQWLGVMDAESAGYAIAPVSGKATCSLRLEEARDLVLGIAPTAGQPFSRIAVLREAVSDTTADPTTLNIDFATIGKPSVLKSIKVGGLQPTDVQTHSVTWRTQSSWDYCGSQDLELAASPGSATDTYAALDPSLVEAGEQYFVLASAKRGGDASSTASVTARLATPVDLEPTLAYANAVLSLAASSPYPRARAVFPPYANATSYELSTSCSRGAGKGSVYWTISVSPEWLGACTDCQVAMPDLSALSCWNDSWVCNSTMPLGVSVYMQANATTTPKWAWSARQQTSLVP